MPKLKSIWVAALSMLLLMAASPWAAAQQSPSGSGLSISPTLSEFTIKPGGSNHVSITLKNVTVDDVVAKGEVDDFTSDNNTGNPKILTNTSTPTPNSIKKFVSNMDDIPLAKGQQKNVVIVLDVPKSTPPGAYYGIIRYRAVPKSAAAPGPGQVALTASVGTIVLITVPGNLREQVQVKGLHVYRGAREGTIFIKPPDSIGITISNFGNGFLKPFGNVEVHNTFNKTVATFQFNNPKELGNILPNSTRTFTNNFKGANKIGRYSVLWLLILVIAVLAILIWLAVRSYRLYIRDRRRSFRR
jgi:hypothetical protein